MAIKYKPFAIKWNGIQTKTPMYVAVENHIVPYTQLMEYTRRFLTRDEAAKELRNEDEVIVELKLN